MLQYSCELQCSHLNMRRSHLILIELYRTPLFDRTKLKKQISTRENVAAAFADAAAEHSSCPSGRKGNTLWK